MVKKDTLAAYDAIAPVYAEYSSKKEAYLNAVDELVIGNIADGVRLLDIGAGDGRRLKKILSAKNLSEAVAIEPSEKMAEICRHNTQCDVHELCGENINDLNIGRFNVITALWNVFGHIAKQEDRLQTLKNVAEKLEPDGICMIDVNNRHNAAAYGRVKVAGRVIIDMLAFDEKRGDANYDWKIDNENYPGFGHLFIPKEIEALFHQARLKIKTRFSINYSTGHVSTSPYQGQLFYILERIEYA